MIDSLWSEILRVMIVATRKNVRRLMLGAHADLKHFIRKVARLKRHAPARCGRPVAEMHRHPAR